MDIPGCYDPVYQAERREAEADRNAVRCEWCDEVIDGDAFIWDGECICKECCEKAVRDNFSFEDIAKALGTTVRRPWLI